MPENWRDLWPLTVPILLGVWVLADAIDRKLGFISALWAIGTAGFSILFLPLYLARRPLRSGEKREWGTGWNLLRNAAIYWTVLMAAATIYAVFLAHIAGPASLVQARQFLEGMLPGIGALIPMVQIGIMGAIWFFPVLGALVLGLLVKGSSIEKGPTRRLAVDERTLPRERAELTEPIFDQRRAK